MDSRTLMVYWTKRFLRQGRTVATRAGLMVVFNWTSEVRAKLGR